MLGHDVVTDYARARHLLGVVPQELVFDPFSPSARRCASGRLFRHSRSDDWIDELLHHLGLASRANSNMRALSGGMKRRMLIGQALVHKPPVIVLDEPTAGVDVELRQSLWSFIRKLNGDGHTIILTTHYLEEAETLCGRIAMLKAGRIVALDTAEAAVELRRITVRLTVAEPLPVRGPAGFCAATGDVSVEAGRLRRVGEHAGGAARSANHDHRVVAAGSRPRAGVPSHHGTPGVKAIDQPTQGAARAVRLLPARGAGWLTLFYKELLRFWKVSFQTILAPVLTALLYLLIFSHVLEAHVSVFGGRVSYTAFLIPGLVMMAVLQNAFANSSSSMIQSKITGNLIFVLLTPLSPLDMFAAYVLGAMVRGLVVGLGVFVVTLAFAPIAPTHPLWALAFALLGSAILGILGLIAGIWSDKFDQLAAFQNFVIVPLTFLSGVFYSIHSLPPFGSRCRISIRSSI